MPIAIALSRALIRNVHLFLQRHFEFIKALDPATYSVFWSEIAAAFLQMNYHEDAIVYYEALAEITVRTVPSSARLDVRPDGCLFSLIQSDPVHVEGRGDCLKAASDFEGASESYEFGQCPSLPCSLQSLSRS